MVRKVRHWCEMKIKITSLTCITSKVMSLFSGCKECRAGVSNVWIWPSTSFYAAQFKKLKRTAFMWPARGHALCLFYNGEGASFGMMRKLSVPELFFYDMQNNYSASAMQYLQLHMHRMSLY